MWGMAKSQGNGEELSTYDIARLQRHAHIAGFLFLFYIAAFAAGTILASSFVTPGDWQRTAAQVAADGVLYRTGLMLQLLAGMSAIPLGFSLYILLRPIDRDWALVAFVWRIAEAALNGFILTLRFAGADVFTGGGAGLAGGSAESATRLLQVTASAAFPVAVLFFSVGSLIFFGLLVRSRFIPVWLAWIGVVGSVFSAALALISLVVPSPPPWLPLLWIPLAIAEVLGGLLLLLKGADLRYWSASGLQPNVAERP